LRSFYRYEYMKIKSTLFISTLLCISCFISCIQDEAPNAEADIHTCFVPDLNTLGDIRSGNDTITISKSAFEVNIWIKPGTKSKLPDEVQISPEFTLTEGATIVPASGSKITFAKDENGEYKHTYTVTAQDGKNFKEYIVKLKEAYVFRVGEDNKRTFSFENSEMASVADPKETGLYHVLFDIFNDEKDYMWSSANAGFAITNGKKATTEDYPTYNSENGVSGKCVRLKTCLVGALGKMVKMPMAAGNFFVGNFDKTNAMKSALTSTKFGVITYQRPTNFEFYYKFKRGDLFTDEELHVIDGELDYPDAYAVLFRPFDRYGKEIPELIGKEATLLDGTSILPDKSGALGNIVAMAKWNNFEVENEDDLENAEFHHASIPFEYVAPYNSINYTDMKEGKYYLTVIFTSSYKGDYFYGAEGSTLYVDEATITFEPQNDK